MKARDLLNDESAIVIFTRGTLFKIEDHGRGKSGNWPLDQARAEKVEKIIIYLRPEDSSVADIFLADNAGITPSEEPGRSVIHLSNLRNVGSTDLVWTEFAETGSMPVRYLGL